MEIKNVVIIGAGPAGISAAIQLKRSGLDPLLLEKNRVGGLLANANLVDNYPGFPRGITGPRLVELFGTHLDKAGVKVEFEGVINLDYEEHFLLETTRRELRSRIVVVASGTEPRKVKTPLLPDDASGLVFDEVYPIAGSSGKRVAIIGAGDAAFDYALNLARRNDVIVLNRGTKRRCLPLLWESARAVKRIEYHENTAASAIQRSGDGVVLICKKNQTDWELQVDYVILATGRTVNRDFLSSRLRTNAAELEKRGLLYFIGDVRNGIYRQSSIAIGDGVSAAMHIYEKLRGTE